MTGKFRGILFLLIAIFLLVLVSAIMLQQKSSNNKKVIGWVPYWDQENAIKSVEQNSGNLDYVSFFWYRVDADGNLSKYEAANEDEQLISLAQSKKLKTLAIVANMVDFHETGSWDHERVDKIISTSEARSDFSDRLVELVMTKNFDGIDMDFEALKPEQRENYALFLEELNRKLKKEGKILGVAIEPVTSDDVEKASPGYSEFLRKAASSSDQLYFMTYLEHGTFSSPGPIASIDWTEKVIKYAEKQGVPKDKIFLGVGLMGVAWKKDGDEFVGHKEDITFAEILNIVKENSLNPSWDPISRSPTIKYSEDGEEFSVWFENFDSVNAKLQLANQLGVGGLGLWRLGGEDQKIWEKIGKE